MAIEQHEGFELVPSPSIQATESVQPATTPSPQPPTSVAPKLDAQSTSSNIQALFDQSSTDSRSFLRKAAKGILLISIPFALWWSAATTLFALAYSSTATGNSPALVVNPVTQVQRDVERTLQRIRDWMEQLDGNDIDLAVVYTTLVDKVKEYLSIGRMVLHVMVGGAIQVFQRYQMAVLFVVFVLPAYVLVALVFPGLAWWFLRKSTPLFWVGVGYCVKRRHAKSKA